MANLDLMCLNNQSHYSLDVIEFQSELYDSQDFGTWHFHGSGYFKIYTVHVYASEIKVQKYMMHCF